VVRDGEKRVHLMKTKKIFSVLFILAAGYWLPVTALYAGVPNLITYQGRLKENNQPVNGSRNIEIFLCDTVTGGSCHTSNSQSVTVSTGLFRSTFTVPGTVDLSAGNWWLELKVESTVLSPREQLSSVPYSLHSASAAYANNLAAAAGAGAVIASTHVYLVNGASLTVSGAVSANIFYGNGSGLTGVTGASGTDNTKVLKAGDVMSGPLLILSSAAILAPDTQSMALWVSTSVSQPILAVSTAGRVGIGIALPYADLHVKGPWILGASNAFPAFGVAGWMNSLQGNLLEGGGGSWANHFVSYGGGDIARFGASASSGATPDVKVVVTNAGKVGIATGAPQGLFQVGSDVFTALSGGNVGIGTAAPLSKLDVLNGSITIRGAQAGLVFEDADRVISSETAAGLGAGIRVSTNVYIVGFSSAAKYYGDGSALTGVAAGSALNVTGIVALSHGGTGADLSSAGGPNQFVRQNSAGGVFSVSAIADADVPDTITLSDLTQVTNRDHSVLTSTGANTHAQLDAHLALTGAAHGATAANTSNKIVSRDATGGFSAGAITVSSITATDASGISASQVMFAGNVAVSSETSSAFGSGIRVSTNVYMVGFSSAARYYGDGSALTGVAAALVPAAGVQNGILGVNVVASSVGLSGFYNAPPVRANLGLAIGTNVQAWDADLDDLADGSLTGSKVGSGVPAANIADGSLGANVLASSAAVNSVYDNAISGVSASKLSGDVPAGNLGNAVLKAGDTMTGALTISVLPSQPSALVTNGVVISSGGVIQTTGTGYGTIPGDPRGFGAVDLQAIRSVAGQVASGQYSALGGGGYNTASGFYSAVGGGASNTAGGSWAVVSGGTNNSAAGYKAVIGGGDSNSASNEYSAAGGGKFNIVSGSNSVVSGGAYNVADGTAAVVAGGENNRAGGAYSGALSGSGNKTAQLYAVAAGGYGNNAGGKYSMIPGGYRNTATGDFSFAAGYQSTAAASGAFAWKDSDPSDSLLNDVADQVRFKAKGGFWVSTGAVYSDPAFFIAGNNNVGMGTSAPAFKLHVAGPGGTIAGLSTSANSTDAAVYGWANSGATAVKGVSTGGGYAGRFEGNVFITDGGAAGTGGKLEVKGETSDATKAALNVINSAGASLLYVRNDGKVGIGEANPAQALVVNGAVTVGDTIGFTTGTIRYNTAAGNHFQGYNGTSWVNFDVSGGGWTTAAGAIYPGTLSDLVGIGIIPAGHKLQVYDDNSTLGQHGIYSHIYPNSGIPTTSYGLDGSKSAIAGLADSNGADAKFFGVAGYLNGASQTDSAGVFGGADKGAAGISPVTWGALGYRDSLSKEWAGYFRGDGYFSGNVDIYNGGSNALLRISADGAAGVNSPVVITQMKNTTGSILPGMTLFSLYANGYNSPFPGYQPAAQISVVADANTGDVAADMPGRIEFATTPDGTGAPQTRMVIKSSGAVGIGITNPTARLEVLETDTSGGAYVLKVGTTSSSSSLAVSTDGAVFVGGDLRARVWQRVFAADLASNMSTFVIPGLRGNTDGEYKLLIRLFEGAMGLCTVKLQPNMDTTLGNYNSQWYGATGPAAVNHVVNTGTLDSIPVATVGTAGLIEQASLIEGTLIARGNPKVYSGTMVSITQQTTRQIGGSWNNAAEITSIQINTDIAGCLGAGTRIELWAFR